MSVERIAVALVQCGGNLERATAYAEKNWGSLNIEHRALMMSQEDAGGATVGVEIDSEFIRALRSVSVVRRLGARAIRLEAGARQTPKITAGAELSYIGEGDNVSVTQQSLGTISFVLRKLAAMVPISGSLMRYAPDLVEPLVRTDLLEGVAAVEDASFLRGPGTEHAPKGIRYWAPAGNVIAANATVTLDNAVDDLESIMAKVEDADIPMRRPGWAMNPRTRRYLMTLRDTSGSFIFKDELSQGRLFGHAVGATTGIPKNLGGGGDESEIIFADFAEVAIADGPMLIDVADGAAYFESGEFRAAYSTDVHTVRILLGHDLAMRHAEGVAVLTEVTWGA